MRIGIAPAMVGTMANRIQIPWLRVAAESGAIVFSILLALAINAWWADRQNRAEEHRLLESLKSELQSNLSYIETELKYRDAVVVSILKIFAAADGEISLEPRELDALIGDVTWWANGVYARSVVDEIMLGGKLSLVEGDELRQLLAGLPHLYEETRQVEADNRDITENVVIPFLSRNASLSQIANTMINGRPGTGDFPTEPLYPAISHRDHSNLLQNMEFLGILVREHWDHLTVIDYLNGLHKRLKRGVALIDIRLEQFR